MIPLRISKCCDEFRTMVSSVFRRSDVTLSCPLLVAMTRCYSEVPPTSIGDIKDQTATPLSAASDLSAFFHNAMTHFCKTNSMVTP
jgi:hypothetical protein